MKSTKLESDYWVKPGNEAIQTRSSSSDSAELAPLGFEFPASHRRQTQPPIVDPRPRSPSPNSYETVDTYFNEQETGRSLSGEVDERRLAGARGVLSERGYEGSRSKQNSRSLEYASKSFRLPKGWKVEEYPRKNSCHVDKYYVERKTGKRFRSLVSVERYLNESENGTDRQQLMLSEYHRVNSKDFSLPDGWIVEDKARKNSSQVDKTYIETGTGKKFRSMASVERYLKAVDSVHPEQLYDFRQVIDPNPPEKVKWVLTGPGGNMFTANMSESDVSSSVKQKWSEAFVSLIKDRS